MIFLVHQNALRVIKVFKGKTTIEVRSTTCTGTFWELAERFPEEWIGWCEQDMQTELAIQNREEIFHHDLIMASYAVKTTFLPDSIGYIDQLPFVNVNRKVLCGTWLMSSDTGGIKGETLLKFKSLLSNIKDFDFLLNSIAKIGQQNGLFCYSAPGLVTSGPEKLYSSASTDQLFEFVSRHYNTVWISVLFWCFLKYEKKFPVIAYLNALGKKKFFQKEVDLSDINIQSPKVFSHSDTIDVIIPTIGRPQHLLQVLKDLKNQTFLPTRVIVVEQNPEPNSETELPELSEEKWPFEVVHHFIHQTGACNARNIALGEVTSKWIFFADDDIRIDSALLEKAFNEIKEYGLSALNINCKQEGEKTVFHKVKQWGSFGSGTSIVKASFAKECSFSLIYEHGYGEDADFGMQLRNAGCDIIYHPEVEILHLKAKIGGFRQKPELKWEREQPLPKPSPTLMVYALKYYTPQQIKGFKISLFLKYYSRQKIRNPFLYINGMRKRWEKSEEWAERLMKSTEKENMNLI